MKRHTMATFFIICAALALSASVMVYADTAEEAKEAYAHILEENNYISDFSLADLNNDEIPEMRAGDPYSFYTYYNGKVCQVGGEKAMMEVYPESGVIKYSRGFKDGGYIEHYCQLIYGELMPICKADDNVYFLNGTGEAISEEEYRTIVDQYTYGQYSIVPFEEYHTNTSENRALYLNAGNSTSVTEMVPSHDIKGVWKNDTCTLTYVDGLTTVYTDESGQVHTVKSDVQLASDGDYFYAISRDTGNIYFFDYEIIGNQLHIWAEERHNGYVEGIIGRSDDEVFWFVASYDDVVSGRYQDDSNTNGVTNAAETEWNADDSTVPESSSGKNEIGITNTDFTYIVEGDHIRITKCNSTDKIIYIPAEIDKIPVTIIGNGCFIFNNTTEKIVIPDSVTEIEDEAFYWCGGLTEIDIPDSVKKIGYNAFEDCWNAERIKLSNNLTEIEAGLFEGCTAVKSIVIPDKVSRIGDGAFYFCTSIQNISIPESVEVIENAAFSACSGLKSITIPASVSSVGMYVFSECNQLSDVYYEGTQEQWENLGLDVNGADVHYTSKDEGSLIKGNLLPESFHLDYSKLIKVPDETDIEFMRSLSYLIFRNHFDWSEEPYAQYDWSNLPKWDEFLMDWDISSSDMTPYEKSIAVELYYFDANDPNIKYDKSDYTFVADIAYMEKVIRSLLYDVQQKDIESFVDTCVKEQTADQYKMYGAALDGPYLPFVFDQVDDIKRGSDTFSISGNIILEEGNGRSVSRDDKRYVSTFKKKVVGGRSYWAFYNLRVFDTDIVEPE